MRLGIPELIIVMVMAAVWLVPVVATVWALVTLSRIRSAQEDMRRKLDVLESLARGGRPI